MRRKLPLGSNGVYAIVQRGPLASVLATVEDASPAK